MRSNFPHTSFALAISKMAYCYAVAKLGPEAIDFGEIKSILQLERDDIYNFFGTLSEPEQLPHRYLHDFHIRERGNYTTVIVQPLASFGGTPFEVVVGKRP